MLNKLELPIVIRECGTRHQILLMPGEEITFNFGKEQKKDDEKQRVQVRMINIRDEVNQELVA